MYLLCYPKQLESLRRHCTITRVGNVKQVSFKPGLEDCYGRCGSDKIRQTVTDTCSGDRESSVTNSRLDGVVFLRPRQHSIGYMGDGFYRSKDPSNSIKVLKGQ